MPLTKIISGGQTGVDRAALDGVLLFCYDRPTGGTALALEFCKQYRKPYFVVDLKKPQDPRAVRRWLQENDIAVVSIGGPRESHKPGVIYARTRVILRTILADTK